MARRKSRNFRKIASGDKLFDSEDDVIKLTLWEKIKAGTRPLKNKYLLPQDVELSPDDSDILEPEVDRPRAAEKLKRKAAKDLPELSAKRDIGSDKNTYKKLKGGKFRIEACLDLHGFSLGEARQVVMNFIDKAYEDQKKCVLVITGKGRHSKNNSDTINSEFQKWINMEPLRRKIISISFASLKDGGSGAFYILIKSKKKSL